MTDSQLETSKDRFLSLCIQYALSEDWLTAEALNEEFPPERLMAGLEDANELRSKLLVEAAGVHEKIAPKKSTTAASEDLAIALEEGVCTPETILELVSVDDHVKHLDVHSLWDLLTRDAFWNSNGEREQARLLHMIETALEQELLDLPALLTAVTPARIAADLPRELVEEALVEALTSGLSAAPLDPEAFINLIPRETWLKHIELSHVWSTVIGDVVAPNAELGEASPAPTKEATAKEATPEKEKPKAKAKKSGGKKKDAAPATGKKSGAESKARDTAIANLKKIDRLPLTADDLSTPLLLAIDAMYAELRTMETDEERTECVEDAFPNPAMLREALTALAGTLDPRMTKEEIEKRGVDDNGLISLVLFEERRDNRAADVSPSSPPPSVPPPPASSVAPKSNALTPPPLPGQALRASAPPPPLPQQARRQR